MKLCMFSPKGADLERGWVGRIDGDQIVHLAAQTLQSFFTGGGAAREHAVYRLDEVELRPPVLHPPSVRVFPAHGQEPMPFFSFRNSAPIFGPDAEIPYPTGTRKLDYGPGVAAVLGARGAIEGFTLANDWTARDLERVEREAGFGPSKSKDFALSIGPVVVTPDELGDEIRIVARVNGDERSRLEIDLTSWDKLAEHAGRNSVLRPGDLLIRSVGGGEPWLEAGHEITLEGAGIGVLRSRIVRAEFGFSS